MAAEASRGAFLSQFQAAAVGLSVACSRLSLPLLSAQSVRAVLHRRSFDAASDSSSAPEWIFVGATEPQSAAESVQFSSSVGVLFEFHEATALRLSLCAAEEPQTSPTPDDGMAALSLSDGEDVGLEEEGGHPPRAGRRLASAVEEATPLAPAPPQAPAGPTLAQAHFFLADLLVAPGMLLEAPLLSGSTLLGTVNLSAKDASRARYRLQLQFRVKKLQGPGPFSRVAAVSCSIHRKERGSTVTSFVKVAETEAVNSADAIWRPVAATVQELCGGNTAARCVQLRVSAAGKEVGHCHVAVDDLLSRHSFPLRSAAGKACGTLRLVHYNLTEEPSFLDLFQDGWALAPIMAIDYTASNGNPATSSSLHHVAPGRLNEYEQTVKAVGEVLESYATDSDIPVFGYGALRPDSHQVSHCFAVSGNDDEPEANGVEGVLEMYRESLAHVALKGPTVFTHVIHRAIDIVHAARAGRCRALGDTPKKKYYVLLIVTDGIIFDWKDTMDAIVEANALPLSIIIVGVGSPADFDKMSALYSENLKSSTGEGIRRKNVTFVPLRQYYEAVNVAGSFEALPSAGAQPSAEASEVQHSVHYGKLALPALSQLPHEVLEYVLMNNISTASFAPETDAMMPQTMSCREPTGATEPPKWESDSQVNACRLCEATFTFTNRKHHCRACGALVCKECSANSRPIPQFSLASPERCCDDCYAVLLRGGLL